MKKILIIDGGVDFHGRGGTLNTPTPIWHKRFSRAWATK